MIEAEYRLHLGRSVPKDPAALHDRAPVDGVLAAQILNSGIDASAGETNQRFHLVLGRAACKIFQGPSVQRAPGQWRLSAALVGHSLVVSAEEALWIIGPDKVCCQRLQIFCVGFP